MKRKNFIYWILIFLLIFAATSSMFLLSPLLSDAERIKGLILSMGIFAPLIFILLQIIQVLLSPLPGQVFGFAGGYIFGVGLGTVYSMIGLILGTIIGVILVKKLGQPIARKLIGKKTYSKFDHFCSNKGVITLFMIYLIPFLPDDAVTLLAGLSKLKLRHILLAAFFGRLPGIFALNLLGAGVAQAQANITAIILGIILASAVTLYLNKDWIQNRIIKILKKRGLKIKNR